jgi:hypothetical protein
MCIIINPIETIYNTKIIISINNKLEQLNIYSNCINNKDKINYMILPVPNPNTLEFININLSTLNNLTQHTFYDDNIPCKEYENIILYKSYNELLSNKLFNSEKLITELLNYSNKLWGFIVCQINIGNFQYMPLCYKHKMIVSHIYIPTKKFYLAQSINNYDWNHVIYLINVASSSVLSSLASCIDYYIINDESDLTIDNKYILGKYLNIDKYFINIKNSNFNIDFYNFYLHDF